MLVHFWVKNMESSLNTRIVISDTRLSISETREGTQLVSALVHELGMALKRSAPRSCPHFHWLYANQAGLEERLLDDLGRLHTRKRWWMRLTNICSIDFLRNGMGGRCQIAPCC